jgi:hypothetical protein
MGSVGLNNVPARVQSGLAPVPKRFALVLRVAAAMITATACRHIEKARLLLPNFSPDGPKVGAPIIFVWYNAEGMRR